MTKYKVSFSCFRALFLDAVGVDVCSFCGVRVGSMRDQGDVIYKGWGTTYIVLTQGKIKSG